MAADDPKSNGSSDSRPRPSLDDLPARKRLPGALQKIADKADKDHSLYDEIYDGNAPESTDSSIRYAGYAARIRTALLSAHRYVAYTSDIGESFRPVAHPWLVRGAYGISWTYVLGDCLHEGYKAYCDNQRVLHPELPRTASPEHYNDSTTVSRVEPVANNGKDNGASSVSAVVPRHIAPIDDYRTVTVQRAVFQSIASMGLPAFTIHSIVRYSGRALKDAKNTMIRSYGPIGLGLAAVPFLPYVFDQPVEEAVHWTFHKAFEAFGSESAPQKTTPKEKEL